jgi:hypothetical protein
MSTIIEAKVCDYDRDFTGCVLGTSERNGYHDSDFYATVWDEEQGCVRTIDDGTTRAYAPSKYHRADATEEVAYSVLMGRRAFIDVGCEVEVVKGRKVAKGTKGEVVWKGRDSFRPNSYRIGLRLLDGTRVYTSMDNVMKLGVTPPSEADLEEWIKSNNPY